MDGDFTAGFRPSPLSAFPLFRRGRSQTGPRAATWGRPYGFTKTFPEIRRAGEDTRPYSNTGMIPFSSQGPGTGRPTVSWNVGRGKPLSPLSRCARHLPLIRGVVPSPTVRKKRFRDWVGEALGPPAGGRASQEGTLIRPLWGHLSLSPLSLRDISP